MVLSIADGCFCHRSTMALCLSCHCHCHTTTRSTSSPCYQTRQERATIIVVRYSTTSKDLFYKSSTSCRTTSMSYDTNDSAKGPQAAMSSSSLSLPRNLDPALVHEILLT